MKQEHRLSPPRKRPRRLWKFHIVFDTLRFQLGCAPQVMRPRFAEWAGHSVAVLLKVYAKCVHGAEAEALQRVWEATRSDAPGQVSGEEIGKNRP